MWFVWERGTQSRLSREFPALRASPAAFASLFVPSSTVNRKQAAAFHRFLPRRSLAQGAAGQEQPRPHASSSYREAQKESVTGHGSVETTVKCVSWGPAHCRERLQNPRFSSASIQRVVPTLVMEREVDTLLRKEAIEVVPPHEREYGFYSWYFIVTKKDRGLHPILDLHQLKRSDSRLKFKMLTLKQVVLSDQVQGPVCHDRSKRCILSCVHPSHSQGVPELCFQGRSLPKSGSSFRPSTLTPHFYKVCGCRI